MELIKKAKTAYISVSIVMLVLGVVLLIWPEMSLSMLCYIVGTVLVVLGAIKLISYFTRDLYRLAFQFDLAIGLLSLLLGVVFLVHPEHIITIMPIVFGVFILVDGVFKMQTAMDAKRFGLETWWIILLLAAATCVFGLLLILRPFEGAVAMMMLLGATLLVDGVQNLWVVIYTVRASERDVIDTDFMEL